MYRMLHNFARYPQAMPINSIQASEHLKCGSSKLRCALIVKYTPDSITKYQNTRSEILC